MWGKELNGRYRVQRRLGSGGMAVVFEARDLLLERDVALKILRTQLANDEDIVRRFKREARAVACLTHPHIVNIFDIGREGPLHYLVMEMIKGGNLKERIAQAGPLDPLLAINYMEQLCRALVAAHHHKIIHCDIKPHNLLLDEEDRIRVTDFGIARAITPGTLTFTEGVVGSAHYLSPEQARGNEVTVRSDIYSAGVVFYELVTGSLPFYGESPISIAIKHIDERPPRPSTFKSIPQAIEKIIMRALEKDPEARYPRAADMLQDLVEAKSIVDVDIGGAEMVDVSGTKIFNPGEKNVLKKKERRIKRKRDNPKKEKKKKEERSGQKEERKEGLPRILRLLIIFSVISFLLIIGIYLSVRRFMQVPEVEVPSLIGLEEEEAQEVLRDLGLSVDLGERIFHVDFEKGLVVDQYPGEGSIVKANRSILVHLSLGALIEEVPDFSGLTLREAMVIMEELSLETGEVIYEHHDEIPEGLILFQDPPPGQEIHDELAMVFVLSQGELPLFVEIPDLIGLSEEEAALHLDEKGLLKGDITKRESLNYLEGVVIGQRPLSGEEVSRGTSVNLIVSSGVKNIDSDPILEHTVEFQIPTTKRTEITIIVLDNNGERLSYRNFHEPGEEFRHHVIGVGDTIIRIYFDDALYREETLRI